MITRDNLKEMAEYVFRNREDYTECILDKTLYIYQDSRTLSFEYNSLTMGLEGIKDIYKSGIKLGVEDINYNGVILNQEERKSILYKLFSHEKG
jgi:hypothetical protein